ncbi:hypothetical protein [Pseudoclavibacter sp. 8L]|uniref:hypothetical protein n=1 Tax=Pseudoclavibacter sp. 8L TaxID=2653162 RepID=UPI0012F120E5|nr:hypothetical protein [Pseudoclavibacter sp. 8L]VXA92776.1 conserved membrane hypothetical protein [Pseudoclavibacter sp. 8L]
MVVLVGWLLIAGAAGLFAWSAARVSRANGNRKVKFGPVGAAPGLTFPQGHWWLQFGGFGVACAGIAQLGWDPRVDLLLLVIAAVVAVAPYPLILATHNRRVESS